MSTVQQPPDAVHLDNSSPIWLQLVAEFSQRIATGRWGPGAKVAGVRELAAELGVNPNTVQRSLAELDRQALSYTERTSGRYVTRDTERIGQLRSELVGEIAADFVARATRIGINRDVALELIEQHWPEPPPHPSSGSSTRPQADTAETEGR